jgi:hypothetical protein
VGARRALELGLLGTLPGKTPDATMASALYTDIKKGGKGRSYFVRCASPPADGPKRRRVCVSHASSCGTAQTRLVAAAARRTRARARARARRGAAARERRRAGAARRARRGARALGRARASALVTAVCTRCGLTVAPHLLAAAGRARGCLGCASGRTTPPWRTC